MKHAPAIPGACAGALGGCWASALAGCSGGSTSGSNTLTVPGDVPIAYAQRVNTIGLNPTDGTPIRGRRRPDDAREVVGERDRAQPHRAVHAGQRRRSDPEVSYDGKKIVFSMQCPRPTRR